MKKAKKTVAEITHPDYPAMLDRWNKYRTVYKGGTEFIDKYLKKLSLRETSRDFDLRKEISYSPSHAKAAIIDIKNAIFQRMVDIARKGGAESYMAAIKGNNGGVDLNGNTMNSFIGTLVLPELISMGKVGIFIDKPPINERITLKESMNYKPYLYIYPTEDIRSWVDGDDNKLVSVLLRDHIYSYNEFGLIDKIIESYRLLTKTEDGILVRMFDYEGNELPEQTSILELESMPLVIAELSDSLLVDVAYYQIALLNLASSDMNYAVKSNFPFYTEQYNPQSEFTNVRPQTQIVDSTKTGTAAEAAIARTKEITVGAAQGRRYPINTERPGFIHPSSEPLKASMEKQNVLKQEIRQLINLALTNIEIRSASMESKEYDDRSLEAGLSYIGLELEHAERQIAEIWSEYEGVKDNITIKYPKNYSLRTDEERRKESKELREIQDKIPSITYQKEISKEIATITLGNKISNEMLDKIHEEITTADVIITDPEVIREDHKEGFVSTEYASGLRGYPKGQVAQAKIDHADRAARIALAQSKAASRGVADMDADKDKSASEEKEASRNTDMDSTVQNKQRGEGKE